MTYKDILRIIPTIQAANLLARNVELAKKKKKRLGDFISAGVDTSVGAIMLKETAGFLD